METTPKIHVLTALLNQTRLLENHGNPEIAAAASAEAVKLQERLAEARKEEARRVAGHRPVAA